MSRASVLTTVLCDKVASALKNGDDYPEAARDTLKRLGNSLQAIQSTVQLAESWMVWNPDPDPDPDPDREDPPELTEFINRVKDAIYDADDVLDRLAYRILHGKAEAEGNQFSSDHDMDERCEVVDRFDQLAYRGKAEEAAEEKQFSSDHDIDELCEVVGRFDKLVYRGKAEENQSSKFVALVKSLFCCSSPFDHDIDESTDVKSVDQLVIGIGEVVKSVDFGSDYIMPQHQPLNQSAKSIPVNPGGGQMVGRAGEREAVFDFLMGTGAAADGSSGGTVEVLSIVGPGGYGKTTLADWAYNHPIVEHHFTLRAWVHVSRQFEPERVMAEIVGSASIETPHDFPYSNKLNIIQKVLQKGVQGRRFLIVLDDVWEDDVTKWKILLTALKFGEEGSRVLVTTRSVYTGRMVCTGCPIFLSRLTEEDCWLLFSVHAFGDESENLSDHLEMEAIAREIAERSDGLPLIAKMLGSLLKSNFNISYWRSIQHNRLWHVDDLDQALCAFRICYEELPEHLKQCFAYCSLFPGDYGFEKDSLVRFWMALGFILPSDEKKLEEIGRGYFDELSQRSFFQKKQHQDGYGIHDVLHELAISVSREECFVFEDNHLRAIPERVRHLFIHADNLIQLNEMCKKVYKNVHSLIIYGRFRSNGFVDIFRKFKGLRVLVLSGVNINLLPESIGELIHLRYLVLQKLDVEKLPESVCKLFHLQGLDVRYCANLLALPSELHNLINLRYLRQ